MVDDCELDENNSNQRVIIVADSEKQRQAFIDTIEKLGLTLVECIDTKSLIAMNLEGAQSDRHAWRQADIWLIDSCINDSLYQVLEHISDGMMLVGFEQAPDSANLQHYIRWQRRLNRKINRIIQCPLVSDSAPTAKKYKPWQHVVLLGASKQDLEAIRSFLGVLPSSLPVVILLVHDVDELEVHHLHQQLSQQNEWQTQLISLSMNMQAGNCYIVPPRLEVVYDSTGRAIIVSEDEARNGEEITRRSPNLIQIMENCSDVFGEQLISVLFTHAALTTALNLEKIHQNRSHIWLQNDFSIANQSITNGILEYSQHQGTPNELAQYLLDYVESC